MKQGFIILLFLCFCSSGFAQYGKLEPLLPNDTSNYVMRTPKETLKNLAGGKDKVLKMRGETIERVERQLEFLRKGYAVGRITPIDVQAFTKNVKWLENNGVNVNYYLEEYFIYIPRKTQRVYRTFR